MISLGPTFTVDWFTQNVLPTANRWLSRFCGTNHHALEIGCFEGRSTIWFLENILTHPDSSILCIDNWQCDNGVDLALRDRFLGNTYSYGPRVRLLEGNSWDKLPYLRAGDQFAWVFVDGSHESWDVLHDAVEAYRLVQPGGLIIFDDYLWVLERDSRPQIGIDAFLSAFSPQRVTLLERTYCVVVRKEPC